MMQEINEQKVLLSMIRLQPYRDFFTPQQQVTVKYSTTIHLIWWTKNPRFVQVNLLFYS